ncbi:MAG: NUDIX domain-containing protein [Clostridia bacterium]|nr:NUDIX domain-containing protein [Clostridia bacterium]
MTEESKMEYSCGAVLYTWRGQTPRYVLVYDSHYGFPKGHIEPGETKEQTALREIYEETGIHARLDIDFCMTDEYELPSKPGIRKEVTFFLASFHPSAYPRPRNEIKRVRVVSFEDALQMLWHPNLQAILRAAHERILERGPQFRSHKRHKKQQ